MKVVLDNNVVLSALLFSQGRLRWLREAWQEARFIPLIDKPCSEELLRVLTYPKFKLTRNEIESLLGDYLPYTKTIANTPSHLKSLPQCRDRDDQKFLILASRGEAEVLVTGDKALLELDGKTSFAIEQPNQFKLRMEK